MFTANSEVLPRWARELARQLEHRGEQAPPEILGPVTSLREVRATSRALLAGRAARSADDRLSLRDDLARALDALGPALKGAAVSTLARVRAELGRIPQLLSETNGALAAAALAEAALEEMQDPRLLGAAWDDLRAAYEDGEFASVCELRTKQLAELVELVGGDWRSTAHQVSQILYDERVTLAEIGALDFDLENAGSDEIRQPAGLDFDKRLALVRSQLAADSPEGEIVAWVCFGNAALRSVYLEVGGVEFFGHQTWPEAVASGWPGEKPRREFEDEWHKLYFDHLPDEPFVLARIPLGWRLLPGAAARARTIGRDLIRAAQPHSEWELADGAALFVAGRAPGWFGQRLAARDYPQPSRRYSPQYEPTGYELQDLDPSLVGRLLAGDPDLHAALRDIEWAETVSLWPDVPQRLALSTRLVERTLPATGAEHWTAPVGRYLKEWWVEHEARSLVTDAAHGAVDVVDSVMSGDYKNAGWRNRLMPSRGEAGYQTMLDETLRVAAELAEDLPPGAIQRRVVEELAHYAVSAESWLELWNGRRRSFDILLARLARQRNAVLHGADTVPEVVSSVVGFGLQLQAFVTHTQLDAAKAGEPLLTSLERNRIRLGRICDRLAEGVGPEIAMFKDLPARTAED